MDFIISLAHFCEVHGPTSILCTQLSPVSCATCHPCGTPPSDDISKNSSFSSGYWEPKSPGLGTSQQPLLYSPFESPPMSPRTPTSAYNPYFGAFPTDRQSFRYSVSSDSDYDACDNCSFLVPKDLSERLPDGAPGSPANDGKSRHGCPVLRSTQAVLAVGPPAFSDEDDEESEHTEAQGTPVPHKQRKDHHDSLKHSPDSAVDSAVSSPLPISNSTHTHYLTYVTTRQPSSPSAYSLLRRSCIRTLSCENLPRGSPSGPLYFGDPIAGYTIAYVFRLADPRARGRRRTYALIALGGRDSWKVSNAMVAVTKVFESIAGRIVAMADRVLERESASAVTTRPATATSSSSSPPPPPLHQQQHHQHPLFSSSLPFAAEPASAPSAGECGPAGASSPAKHQQQHQQQAPRLNLSDVSSFLSAKKVDPDGYPRVSRDVMRAKGLAEIVGRDSFFVELHAQFCVILAGLVREFGGR